MASIKESNIGNKVFTWWEKPPIQYAFFHPLIRLRLEKLMGTNVCSLTDRDYMTRLQIRILEDYAEKMDKRIKTREAEELERVKNLVLNGTIPLSQAPPEMADHPVMLIDAICNKLIAERRAKIKIPKVKIPTFLYWDDTPDPESGLTIQKGHVFRGPEERLCLSADRFLNYSEEHEEKYSLPQEEYDKIIYINPLVRRLLECESVEEIYELAEEITGSLKPEEVSRIDDEQDNLSTLSTR
ncbi:uncharacterized protein LOC130899968 isoform X1 [Diorhabda carinulata]|uniref:uncharacterized protein LOC130899968 isoform X1 n=2 Tax=Diorhabda carinulata TaxID=1163345 RepID=UPI0025A02B4A|nr:uncharacterized protein LOC130899968 isoform X1 [Diorhabda carinulata]